MPLSSVPSLRPPACGFTFPISSFVPHSNILPSFVANGLRERKGKVRIKVFHMGLCGANSVSSSLFIFFTVLLSFQDLNSPSRGRTCAPCSGSSES